MAMTIEQWMDGDKMRMEYTGGSDELTGTVMVMDGKRMSMYMASTNQYMETDVPDFGTAGSSPAQAPAMTRAWVDEILKTNTVTLDGVEEVAGRRTYKLSAVPRDGDTSGSADGGGAASLASTMWVDSETYYPLKLDLTMGPVHMTMTTRQVEYNQEIPDDRFVLGAPPGSETMDLSLPEMQSTTVVDAQAAVSFDLLELDAGESDYELESSTLSEIEATEDRTLERLTQTYRGPSGQILVMQMPAMGDLDLAGLMGGDGDTRMVDVSGNTANVISLGVAGTMVVWRAGDTQITLSGQVPEDEILTLAGLLH
jgi:outer membrane lipoprotein-sorting protein